MWIWFDRLTTRERWARLLAKYEPHEGDRVGHHRTQDGTDRHREPIDVVVYNPNEKRIYVVPRKREKSA